MMICLPMRNGDQRSNIIFGIRVESLVNIKHQETYWNASSESPSPAGSRQQPVLEGWTSVYTR